MKGVEALLVDKSFTLPSVLARSAYTTGEQFLKWIETNKDKACRVEKEIAKMLCTCFGRKRKKQAKYREVMWSTYHTLRTSVQYCDVWKNVLKEIAGTDSSCTFYQYVGHFMFKELIKIHHPVVSKDQDQALPPLNYRETNALRYVSGYIPRLLRKRLQKSTHKLREDLKLCIFDLLDDGDEVEDSSKDWLKSIDRGGLTRVNNATYDVFFAIEHEIRLRLRDKSVPPDLSESIKEDIFHSEDVQFFWSMLSAEWEEESGDVLLEMIVNQYVKIRGFSSASAWLEEYKQASKKTTQKSKGVRKQLITPTADVVDKSVIEE